MKNIWVFIAVFVIIVADIVLIQLALHVIHRVDWSVSGSAQLRDELIKNSEP